MRDYLQGVITCVGLAFAAYAGYHKGKEVQSKQDCREFDHLSEKIELMFKMAQTKKEVKAEEA